jgi:hypothetical protein
MLRTGWSFLFADGSIERIHRSRSTENGLAPGSQNLRRSLSVQWWANKAKHFSGQQIVFKTFFFSFYFRNIFLGEGHLVSEL